MVNDSAGLWGWAIIEHLFNGSALCAVDGGGHVNLPPFVHATIERRWAANMLMIGPHEADPCLSGYDRGYARILQIDHERRRLAEDGTDAHHARARRTFGSAEDAPFSAGGTVVLIPMMRRRGGIKDFALFVGVGGTFEIWDPQRALDSADATLRELAAWRLEDYLPPAN